MLSVCDLAMGIISCSGCYDLVGVLKVEAGNVDVGKAFLTRSR